jgi:hypothetical protein
MMTLQKMMSPCVQLFLRATQASATFALLALILSINKVSLNIVLAEVKLTAFSA